MVSTSEALEKSNGFVTLESLCDIISDTCSHSYCEIDSYVSTESMIPNKGGITCASSIPMNGTVNKYSIGDVLISNIRPYFKKIWLADRSGTCSNDVLVFRSKKCSPRYLFYILSSDSFFDYVMSSAKGTKMPRGDKESIKKFNVLDRSLKSQEGIVNLLKPLDNLIFNNSIINDYLVKLMGAITRQFIGVAHESNSRIAIGNCCKIYNGYSYSRNELIDDSNVALVTIKNFDRNGGFKIEGYKPLHVEKNVKEFQYTELFDLLIACTDLTQGAEVIGNSEMILDDGGYEKLIISMDLVKIEPDESIIGKFALMAILSTGDYKEYAKGCVNGTTVLHLDKTSIPKYEIPIPDNKEILSLFNSKIALICNLRSQLSKQNRSLSEIRDALLPKLMSGEIDVSKLDLGS